LPAPTLLVLSSLSLVSAYRGADGSGASAEADRREGEDGLCVASDDDEEREEVGEGESADPVRPRLCDVDNEDVEEERLAADARPVVERKREAAKRSLRSGGRMIALPDVSSR
jgi:hypothetical protein